MIYQTRTTCRSCGAGFDPLLNLGTLYLSTFLAPDDPVPPQAPLDLVVCQACDLVQLRHTVHPDLLYRSTYWYQSGINEAMVKELEDVVRAARSMVPAATRWVDVGANDGTLLRLVKQADPTIARTAVEPAQALQEKLAPHADTILQDLFPAATQGLPTGSIDILTSIAMFYDLDDPRSFVREVDRLLTRNGVWIVQMQDLGQMVGATAFDNICFEHLCYYSAQSFEALLEGTDLHTVQIEPRTINGGSLRFLVQRRTQPRVDQTILLQESRERSLDRRALEQFAWRAGEVRTQLKAAVQQLLDQGTRIDLYGASTKANTLLQWVGLGAHEIRWAVERSPEKVGRITPTGIPILSEAAWRADPDPVTLVGIWAFRESILHREAQYLQEGGSFFFPLPHMEVVVGTRH